MKIVACHVMHYERRLTRPVTTHVGVFVTRSGHWVRLQDEAGRTGVGDAAHWPGFGSTPEVFAGGAARVEALLGRSIADVPALETLLTQTQLPPEWAYAFELACLDLLGQRLGVSVARLVGESPRQKVPVHALVSNAVAAKDAVAHGARAVKFKVGARLLEEDILRVGAVRAAIGSDVGLRVDANGAWSPAVATRALRLLAAFTPEWIEQPVPAGDIAGLRQVRDLGIMPVAADESADQAERLQTLLADGAADFVVLKPMAVGGLLACRRAATQAARHGVRVVITHALESGVGRLGALHLAAALPQAEAVCGLGGALEGDIVAPAVQRKHVCDVPDVPGLGVVGTALWHAGQLGVAS